MPLWLYRGACTTAEVYPNTDYFFSFVYLIRGKSSLCLEEQMAIIFFFAWFKWIRSAYIQQSVWRCWLRYLIACLFVEVKKVTSFYYSNSGTRIAAIPLTRWLRCHCNWASKEAALVVLTEIVDSWVGLVDLLSKVQGFFYGSSLLTRRVDVMNRRGEPTGERWFVGSGLALVRWSWVASWLCLRMVPGAVQSSYGEVGLDSWVAYWSFRYLS